MSLRLSKRTGSPFWWITGTVNGQRIRESSGIRIGKPANERLASEKCAARELAEQKTAIYGRPARRHLFAEVALSYLEHGGQHTDDTVAKVKRLASFFGAGMAADDVDQAALDGACTGLLRTNPAPATRLRQVISPARAVLTHGAKRRMCAIPVFDCGKPGAIHTEWLNPEQVDALIGSAAPHLRPLLAFLAGTGARLGEALKLEWKDVDLPNARATLRLTKNGSDRVVDLCPRVIAGLLYDPRSEAAARRRGRKGKASDVVVVLARVGRVFLTRSGRPYAERKAQGGGQIADSNASRPGIPI